MRLKIMLVATLVVVSTVVAAQTINATSLFYKVITDMWVSGCSGNQKLVGTFQAIPTPIGKNNSLGQPLYYVKASWVAECQPLTPSVSSLKKSE